MGAPILINGVQIASMQENQLANLVNPDLDRVLVLVRMSGGNDGLNTILPLDQYDGLSEIRPNILIPQKHALRIGNNIGLHPSMKHLKWMFEEEKLNIIHSVGYPNQNRSHFRSMDIWTTGSPANEVWTTGWMGRYLDDLYPNFPEDYPNATETDPFAIAMGSLVSETCQGRAANFSMALNDPFNLSPLAIGTDDTLPDTPYGEELAFLRVSVAQTNAYSEVVSTAAEKGANKANYPEENRLAEQLKNVALLISGGLQTKIYVVNIGGFDTHANQAESGSSMVGVHATLLRMLSEAVAAFHEDLELLGLQDRVVGITFSEFGRRIHSNDSLGTDHGTATPLLLFGTCVNNQLLGENPEIDAQVDPTEGLPMQFDFRDIYGSILTDWFELEESAVKRLFHDDFQYYNLVTPCNSPVTSIQTALMEDNIQLSSHPNPFQHWTAISFTSESEWAKLSLYDALGKELAVLVNRKLPKGTHTFNWEARGLPSGNYFYRLQLGRGLVKTKRMIKK